MSSITSTAPRAFALAERFRAKGIPIVMGGPHSTFLPEESLRYADYVVRGEGEDTILELLEHLESGTPLDAIKGLSYRKGESFAHNPDRPLVQDLDASPIPDFGVVHNWGKKATIPIATSRGCPFGCRFCSVIQMFGRKYRFKSVDRVIEELRAAARMDTHIFFIDDNFAANRERTKALLRRIISEGMKLEWSAQVRTDVAKDEELLNLMAKAGCFMVFVGFESINPRTLSLYNKKQSLEDIIECIGKLHNAGIRIHGMFVFGGDTDDIQTIRSTEKFAKRLNINSIQFMMLTPLPGTPVFYELMEQGRIIHTDWAKYDAHHAVFEPKLMTAFELHTETLKAMSHFYSCGSILRNILRGDLFYTIVSIYGKRSLAKIKTPSREYLRQLRSMVAVKFDQKAGRLREYLLTKKKTVRNVVMSRLTEGGIESVFFRTFFEALGKTLVISAEEPHPSRDALTILPVLNGSGAQEEPPKRLVSELYEQYRSTLRHASIVPLETTSLYRACVYLGLLMGIRMKKIRKAYEKAIQGINGKAFDCYALLLISPAEAASQQATSVI
ncbi:MAG: B12-binding domain-containing radical SAM protein [Nitrospirae bacterium]|nr:B12-binding domain-containing radical SAM protein [Nitrospirota bacterium]